MSEMSKEARRAMRAKADRMARTDPHKRVDASSWEPNEPLNTYRKTGARPIRSRIYKAGGRIQGDRGPKRGDKAPRGGFASGGAARDSDGAAYNIHSTVKENQEKLGNYHVGAYKSGGKPKRQKREMGGMTDPRDTAQQGLGMAAARAGVPPTRFQTASSHQSPLLKKGGKVEKGGTYFGGTRPTGGRMPKCEGGRTERKSGGRTKGKTNINIIIGRGHAEPPQMPPQGVVRPPPPPPPMPAMPPPGMPPGGPSGVPVMPPGGPAPGGPPPMMRKSGGRAFHPHAGAGSGEGRLEKAAFQKRNPRKAGGGTYRSAKDMDAGAGSGLGRLEKTEIQAHKG